MLFLFYKQIWKHTFFFPLWFRIDRWRRTDNVYSHVYTRSITLLNTILDYWSIFPKLGWKGHYCGFTYLNLAELFVASVSFFLLEKRLTMFSGFVSYKLESKQRNIIYYLIHSGLFQRPCVELRLFYSERRDKKWTLLFFFPVSGSFLFYLIYPDKDTMK